MLEMAKLRQNPQEVSRQLKNKGYDFDVEGFLAQEERRKSLQVDMQKVQEQRNRQSKSIGQAKAQGQDIKPLLQTVEDLGEKLKVLEKEFHQVQEHLNIFLSHVPNLPDESVPIGKNDADNQEIRRWGEPRDFDFTPKEHDLLGEELNHAMDFELSAKLSGSRFVVLKGELARLHRALAQFMLDTHVTKHGYQEIYTPLLVKPEILYGTGQFPKLKEDQFGLADGDLWLIPTAESPLTNLVRESIIDAEQLPMKFACHSACFRKEAGSYGKDTKGMIRQHQFEKVELVQIVAPEHSYAVLEELTSHAEFILQALKLPYRVMMLCSGDLGFSSAKTYDLEVWLPSQNCYREISSCSNMVDFQARRMKTRYRRAEHHKPELVHSLNGSGVAVGRALVAVMENYQNEQGQIEVPEVLQPYLGGQTIIG